MKQPVVLKIYHGQKLESVRQFDDKQIVIGREGQAQLLLKGEDVSPIHAIIEERDGRYFISDLGSKTGTRINGQNIVEELLNSGDEIVIGSYVLQFHIGVPKATAPPKSDPIHGTQVLNFDDEDTQSDFEMTIEPAAPMLSNPTHKIRASGPVPSIPSHQPRNAPVGKNGPAKKEEPRRPAFVAPNPKKNKTFAPPSKFKDAKEFVKPGKGTSVEVLVVWKDRVLNTYHFNEAKPVFIGGGDDADVVVPILSSRSKYQLLKIGTGITVCLAPEMTGELVRDGSESVSISELSRQGKLRNTGGGFELDLRQGEMVRIGLQNDMISLMVRYKAETPKPMMAPLLDLTASETTGVILAAVISAIFFLYMSLYAPQNLMDDEARVEEPIRKAIVTFSPPKVVEEKKEEPVPQPKKVVEVSDKQKSVMAEKKSATTPQKADAPKAENKPNPGKAAEVAPKDTKDKQKKLTSVKPGGAVKTAPKEGANMKSDKPDPSKAGILGVFSSKGTQAKLDKAYSGSGELAGMAKDANGMAGSDENRAGDSMGTKLKDTGAGGKGTSTIGIAGVGTNGRGTGNTGYGTGGLGGKGSVKIDAGGQDATFYGSIDKEAIRRVILAHRAEIRFCYDQELQKNPSLAGKISIGWYITETGAAVKTGVANNDMGNATVANCIVNKLKTWTFPAAPPDVEAHVIYPFVFSSN